MVSRLEVIPAIPLPDLQEYYLSCILDSGLWFFLLKKMILSHIMHTRSSQVVRYRSVSQRQRAAEAEPVAVLRLKSRTLDLAS